MTKRKDAASCVRLLGLSDRMDAAGPAALLPIARLACTSDEAPGEAAHPSAAAPHEGLGGEEGSRDTSLCDTSRDSVELFDGVPQRASDS